jgi:hypothetical protein
VLLQARQDHYVFSDQLPCLPIPNPEQAATFKRYPEHQPQFPSCPISTHIVTELHPKVLYDEIRLCHKSNNSHNHMFLLTHSSDQRTRSDILSSQPDRLQNVTPAQSIHHLILVLLLRLCGPGRRHLSDRALLAPQAPCCRKCPEQTRAS